MDNQYGLQAELITVIRAAAPQLRTVAGFSLLASTPNPAALLDACFVLPTGTDDSGETRDDEGRLLSFGATQEWQVLVCVPNRPDPRTAPDAETLAGEYLARIRAALLSWDVPPELGGRLHPGGVSAPVHLRDFSQYPCFFRQYQTVSLEVNP